MIGGRYRAETWPRVRCCICSRRWGTRGQRGAGDFSQAGRQLGRTAVAVEARQRAAVGAAAKVRDTSGRVIEAIEAL